MYKYLTIIAIFLFVSCGEYENLELQRTLDKRVDSIFYAHKDSLKKLNDSLCTSRYEKMVEVALDSIKKVNIEKIKSLNQE